VTKNPPYEGFSRTNIAVNNISPLYKNYLPDQNAKTGINALPKILSKFSKRGQQQGQDLKRTKTFNDEVVDFWSPHARSAILDIYQSDLRLDFIFLLIHKCFRWQRCFGFSCRAIWKSWNCWTACISRQACKRF